MTRPRRHDRAGCVYHCLNRGNKRARIFHSDNDYAYFETLIARAKPQFELDIYSFVLMPNHWHKILSPRKDGEMGRYLAWTTQMHTQRLHRVYGTKGQGHIYQGRYKSFQIQDDVYLERCVRYIERNPLASGLVRRAEDWVWGSLWRRKQSERIAAEFLTPFRTSSVDPADMGRPFTAVELEEIRLSISSSRPYGDQAWVEAQLAARRELEAGDP